MALSIERRRAAWIFIAVVGATAATAVVVFIQNVVGANPLAELSNRGNRDAATDCAALGIVLAAAAGLDSFTRRDIPQPLPAKLGLKRPELIVSLTAFSICVVTIVLLGDCLVLLPLLSDL